MRMMTRASGAIAGLWLVVQAAAGANNPPSLVGKWQTVDTQDGDTWVMEFRADGTIDSRGSVGEMFFTGKYRVDYTTSPMQLDFLEMKGSFVENKGGKDMIIGIMEFRGPDELRIIGENVSSAPDARRPPRATKFGEDTMVLHRVGAAAAVEKPTPAPAAASSPAVPALPPAKVATVNTPPVNPFIGRWELVFDFMRNTGNTNEAVHPWITFDAEFKQDGNRVVGELKARGGNPSGTVKGGTTADGLMGTLRLSWDDHDWQVFTLRLTDGANAGEGIAIFAPQPTTDAERHVYLVRCRKAK